MSEDHCPGKTLSPAFTSICPLTHLPQACLVACLTLFLTEIYSGYRGILGGSVVKNPPTNARDMGLIPESGRSPGEGNGNPFEYSCLGNSMDGGVWHAIVSGVVKSWI